MSRSRPSSLIPHPSSLLIAACLLLAPRALADEQPDFALARGLRAKGLPDLALEYLQRLKTHPPAGLDRADLALETGLTEVEAAAALPAAKREQAYAQAQTDLSAFINAHPGDDRSAQAQLALIRIVVLQGRALLADAARTDNPAARQAERVKARPFFEQADKRLQQAAADAAAALAKAPGDEATRRRLIDARLHADLDRGLNLLDLASTYSDTDEVIKRGEVIDRAAALFRELENHDVAGTVGWQARAWLGRCYQEKDEPAKALEKFTEIIGNSGPEAEPAKRLARAFRLAVLEKDPSLSRGDPHRETKDQAEAWLSAYPAFSNTPEGQTVQFLLANALLQELSRLPRSARSSPSTLALYARAQNLFETVERAGGPNARAAGKARLRLIFERSQDRTHGDVTKLKDFEEGFLLAQVEIARMSQEDEHPTGAEKDPKQQESRRKQHLQTIIAALAHALDLPDATDRARRGAEAAEQISEARFILAYAYLATGDDYRAAVLGDDLARNRPASRHAPGAAAYALEAYARIIADEVKGDARPAVLDADRRRLADLASFTEQTWPADPAADLARHQLGSLAFRDKRFPEAVAVLSRISPAYGSYTFSQYELASAALSANDQGLAPPPGQRPYLEQAADALRKIPDITDSADPATAQAYMFAKLKLARLLFAARQFPALDELAAKLRNLIRVVRLDETAQKEIEAALDSLPFYITFGRAEDAFRAGRYADARKLLEPTLADIRKGSPASRNDPALTRGLLALSLRASVQVGDTQHARDDLDLLQKTAPDWPKGGATAVLVDLVRQLKTQVEDLRRQGPDRQKELDQLVDRFTSFLDDLARPSANGPSAEMTRFLALSYAGLGKHDKAADLFARLLTPSAAPQSADPAKAAAYQHSVRLSLAREYRLAKQFDRAAQVLRELGSSEQGKKSIEARKESILLLQDQEKFVPAAKAWKALMDALQPLLRPSETLARAQAELDRLRAQERALQGRPLTDTEQEQLRKIADQIRGRDEVVAQERKKQEKYKEEYYDCYYQFTYCFVENAVRMKDESRRLDNLGRAARFITDVEAGQPELWNDMLKKRFDDLFQREPLLKEKYDERKKGTP